MTREVISPVHTIASKAKSATLLLILQSSKKVNESRKDTQTFTAIAISPLFSKGKILIPRSNRNKISNFNKAPV